MYKMLFASQNDHSGVHEVDFKESFVKEKFALKSADFGPTFYLGPEFDPMMTLKSLTSQLNDNKVGALDQTSLYLDPISAADWLAVEQQADYQSAQQDLPLQEIAETIYHYGQQTLPPTEILDVICLGPGSAEKELRLLQHLVHKFKKIRIFLIDASQPLLTFAYKSVLTTLAEFKNTVSVYAVMADMYHLARFLPQISPLENNRKRLITMLGYTFTNLQNEILFIRNSLQGLSSEDMLLFDVGLAVASGDDPEEINRLEPRLNKRLPDGWNNVIDRWLAGPLLRYCRNLKDLQFFHAMDNATCCIPGSYAIEKRARITTHDNQEKVFVVQRFKRYDSNKLILKMKEEGWGPGAGWVYGQEPKQLMYLFRKLPPTSSQSDYAQNF